MTPDDTPPSPEAILSEADFVRSLARSLLADPQGADDLAQDTLIAALERPPARHASLRAWLASVVRNGARQRAREEGRRRRREEASGDREPPPTPDEILAREALRRRVVDAVLALDAATRDVLLLRHWEALAAREIARRLGIPVETVRTRIKRGHARLRAVLEEERGADWRRALLPLAGAPAGIAAGVAVSVGAKLALAAGVAAGAWGLSRPAAGPAPGEVAPRPAAEAVVALESPAPAAPRTEGREERAPEQAVGERAPAADPAVDRLAGRVRTQRGEPVAGARVTVEPVPPPDADDTAGAGEEAEGLRGLGYAGPSAPVIELVTGADGRFETRLEDAESAVLRVASVPDSALSVATLEPLTVELPAGSVELVVPDAEWAMVRVRARERDTGTALDRFACSGLRRDATVVASAVEGVAELCLPVHPWEQPTEYVVRLEEPRIGAVERALLLSPGESREVVLVHDWLVAASGAVVDSRGRPVAGAAVHPGPPTALRRGGLYYLPYRVPDSALRTDEGGRFHLVTSQRQLTVYHPDHSPVSVSTSDCDRIVLPARAAIRGTVTGPGGLPREGVRVFLDHMAPGGVRTDERGAYLLDGVEAGVHKLQVGERGFKVELDPGEELVIDVPAGLPVVRCRIESETVAIPDSFSPLVLGTGRECSVISRPIHGGEVTFEDVLPGEYWLVNDAGWLTRMDLSRALVTVRLGEADLVVECDPDHEVHLVPADAPPHVEDLIRFSARRRVPADGRLEWPSLTPGDYVAVRGDGERLSVRVDGPGTTAEFPY